MLRMESVNRMSAAGGAVAQLNLHAPEGSIYALVGAADSGKSTVLALVCGLLTPDSGRIVINGLSMSLRANRRRRHQLVGYMPAKNAADPNLKLIEYLEFYAHIYGKYGLSARENCMELLRMTGLDRRSDSLMSTLPGSILREAEFLRCLIHRPKLLLADEPFSGMDARERAVTEEIMRQLAAEGVTIVLTSTSLADSAMLCDSLGLMDQGKMMDEGSREDVLERLRADAPIYFEVADDPEKAVRFLSGDEAVQAFSWQGKRFKLQFLGDAAAQAELLGKMVSAGISVSSFRRGDGTPGGLFGGI